MDASKRPIRILEVFGKMNRGGAEAMIMNLYRKMDRSRVQLDFMVHTEEHCQFDDEIEQLGGRIYRVPRFKVYNLISYCRSWRRFFKSHSEYHVVHGHIGSTAAIYLHEANRVGCFTIAHSHSASAPTHSLHNVFYSLFSWPTRFVAKQLFGCSTEAGIARFGRKAVKSARYRNFPNAIELDNFMFKADERTAKRRELGIHPEQLVVIHVGRITTQKNPSMILQIFKEIIEKDNHAICLWVGTGELSNTYQDEISREGLSDRIIMTGVRHDIPQLLMASDVFLFPSLWEGLPVSVIEAQASGLPCVISDAISREVAVTPLVEWHSLSEPAEEWANRCLEVAAQNLGHRESPLNSLSEAGYGVQLSAKKLQDYYLKVNGIGL